MSFNAWVYAYGNAVNLTDPSGHDPWWCNDIPDPRTCGTARASIPTPTPTPIPLPTEISKQYDCPDPQYYECENKNGICLSKKDDAILQITHTIFGEGGSLSEKAAANVIQTVLNRAYIYWEITHHNGVVNPNGRTPWKNMNKRQFTSLLLYVLSEPYLGGDGNEYPTYNAWGAPYPHEGLYWNAVNMSVKELFNYIGIIPALVRVNVDGLSPASEIKSDVNVIYYAASSNLDWVPKVETVHMDNLPDPNPQLVQYYGRFPIKP